MEVKLLFYVTKNRPWLVRIASGLRHLLNMDKNPNSLHPDTLTLNGKIVAESDFEVIELMCDNYEDARDGYIGYFHALPNDDFEEGENELLKRSHLDELQLNGYLKDKNGYGIVIKNLEIYDKPKELKDYKQIKVYKNGCSRLSIEHAPQNMMKCKEFTENGVKDYILISVRPEWMVHILNRTKDIEVRRMVLKEMLQNVR